MNNTNKYKKMQRVIR